MRIDLVLADLLRMFPDLMAVLGAIENRRFKDELNRIEITKPVFVMGLARSGTTIILESLAASSRVATHRYRDFPAPDFPIWWSRFQERFGTKHHLPEERAHGDGLLVTPDSPEAMEEPIWIRSFPTCHDPIRNNVLGAAVRNERFESHYRTHIRKILFLRNGDRYVSKANYNLARLGYLKQIFPDARFVVVVRAPEAFVASSVRQQAHFCARAREDKDVVRYMRSAGHFEFGPDRRPVNFGNAEATAQIEAHWARGEEFAGWAKYWSDAYSFICDQLESDASLWNSVKLVTYEKFCRSPEPMLRALFSWTQLEPPGTLSVIANDIKRHRSSAIQLGETERELVSRLTNSVAERVQTLV